MNGFPTLTDLALFAAGFVSWAISTLAAGGGSVLIVAAVAVDPARPGGRTGGDNDQRACEPGTDDPAVALDRLARGALVPAGRRSGCDARRLDVQPDEHAMAADRAGTLPDQHRVAIPDGRTSALVRDATAVVPAGFVRLGTDVGGGGRERTAGEPVLSQLRADEGGDAGDASGEFAGDPAREDRRLRDVRRAALAAWRDMGWWQVRARSWRSGWPIRGCGISHRTASASSPCWSCCSAAC